MKASDISLQDIFRFARGDEELATALSFIQVEYGLLELLALWDAFVDESNFIGQTYGSHESVAFSFYDALLIFIADPEPLCQ
jgi:hypothetical protein